MCRNSEDALEAVLARLAAMDLAGLRRRWRILFGRSAPEGLPRSLLQRVVAYRVQADALGDLDRDRLTRSLADFAKSSSSCSMGMGCRSVR